VCGLRPRLDCPDFIDLIHKYEIFCCTETKLDTSDIIDIDSYQYFSQPRKQKYIRKSGGLGAFVSAKLVNYTETINSDSDYIFWLKFKKGSILKDHDVILGVIYIPPDSSRFFNNDELLLFEHEINDFNNKYDHILLSGDTNGYTSNLCDFVQVDDFIADLFTFDQQTIDHFDQSFVLSHPLFNVNRTSMDNKVNTVGRKLIEICQNNNMFIVNGRCSQDMLGNFTLKTLT